MSHYHITRGEPHVAGAQDLKTGLITLCLDARCQQAVALATLAVFSDQCVDRI
jgi:hypothetical protein